MPVATVLATMLVAGLAESEPPRRSEFWAPIASAHKNEVADAVSQARSLYQAAQAPVVTVDDERLRERKLADARGMLDYAQRFAPDDREVLELRARVDEASGRVGEALAVYQRLFERRRGVEMTAEACLSYGLLAARAATTGHERAIAILRRCVGESGMSRYSSATPRVSALISLSNLHAADGRIGDAIVLLEREDLLIQYGYSLLPFALAVLYDKDGQITQAFEVLERHNSLMQSRLFSNAASEIGSLLMVPAEDRHYYTALLLEVGGALPEAREEWHHYLRSGPRARFAGRARQHIEAIDGLLSQRPSSSDASGLR